MPVRFHRRVFGHKGLTAGLAVAFGCACEGSCFVGSTRVKVPGGDRAIRELRLGDEVMAYDLAAGTLVAVRVRAVHSGRVAEVYRVTRPGGVLAGVTASHPIFEVGLQQFVRADELAPESRLLVLDGVVEAEVRPAIIEGIERVALNDLVTVFNLTVDGPSTYFAEGVLVHNKSTYDRYEDTRAVVDSDANADASETGPVAADTAVAGDAMDGEAGD